VGQLGGKVRKIRLIKLLYIADRDHFLQHGYPITGDDQYAMPLGPVPSKTLDLLDGDLPESDQSLAYLQQKDFIISIRKNPEQNLLSQSEIAVLDQVLRVHGQKDPWVLVKETHEYPEYKGTYKEDTSTRIPYEKILECYETGDGKRFRHGRPVVSRATIPAMRRPLRAWK